MRLIDKRIVALLINVLYLLYLVWRLLPLVAFLMPLIRPVTISGVLPGTNLTAMYCYMVVSWPFSGLRPCLLMILASDQCLWVPMRIGSFSNNLLLLVLRNVIWWWIA
jgi:hypothetical protein